MRTMIETAPCPQLIAVLCKPLDESIDGALEEYELVVDLGLGDAFLAGACSCGACTTSGPYHQARGGGAARELHGPTRP